MLLVDGVGRRGGGDAEKLDGRDGRGHAGGTGGQVRRRVKEMRAVTASLEKRSVSLRGHRTSVALEPEFWRVLDARAERGGSSLASLLIELDEGRGGRPLASACRVAALAWAAADREA